MSIHKPMGSDSRRCVGLRFARAVQSPKQGPDGVGCWSRGRIGHRRRGGYGHWSRGRSRRPRRSEGRSGSCGAGGARSARQMLDGACGAETRIGRWLSLDRGWHWSKGGGLCWSRGRSRSALVAERRAADGRPRSPWENRARRRKPRTERTSSGCVQTRLQKSRLQRIGCCRRTDDC